MSKHKQTGYAIILTKAAKGWCPRFATIGKSILVRPKCQCLNWLKNKHEGGEDGRVVKVEVREVRNV